MSERPHLVGPDLTVGIAQDELLVGASMLGHVRGEQVLLARTDGNFLAVGAHCTHYQAPLIEGLLVGATIRCPWHHACFDLRTGEALRVPALDPLPCWEVELRQHRVFVGKKKALHRALKSRKGRCSDPRRIVIVGGGAAGLAAAEMLRREQFDGTLTILSDDHSPPVDRPNLSKGYLAGTVSEELLPLRPAKFYSENDVKLLLATKAGGINLRDREIEVDDGSKISFDRLLLATGADPVRLWIPGGDQPHVRTLRTLADSRAIIELAKTARRAVILGASFISLEVAAALRVRGIDVAVVAPDKLPMERVLGPQIGNFVRSLHAEHGVTFHLEDTAIAVEGKRIRLKGGSVLEADLVVAGVGVRPRTELAIAAGLAVDRGVAVNAYLETSQPIIFAAGDIVRWPDQHSGERIRVEHWAVAERQGQIAALNMLGRREKFEAIPFFWSRHYDVPINYVGHATAWDEIAVEGDIIDKDCLVRFKQNGRTLAAASIFRDLENLNVELALERIGSTNQAASV